MSLKEIIEKKYLHHGDYTLSSGAKSTKYFDIKGMLGNYDDLYDLLAGLDETMRLNSGGITGLTKYVPFCLGGTELGGALLVAAMMYRYNDSYMVKMFRSACYIRKQQRIHGLKKMIEGQPKSPILLVDDVISSAATAIAAVLECWKNDFDVCGLLCVINRYGSDILPISEGSRPQIPIYSLFHESDFD